jgi:hypothetical protein
MSRDNSVAECWYNTFAFSMNETQNGAQLAWLQFGGNVSAPVVLDAGLLYVQAGRIFASGS